MAELIDERAGPCRDEPHSVMRKTIARRLSESKATVPHYYLSVDVRVDAMLHAREQFNANSSERISVNDIAVWCTARALLRHPLLNASWRDDAIRYYQRANVGVAMAVPGGLVVPVVKEADTKPAVAIAAELRDFARKAKERKLKPFDWEGNTFTVSNLGMHGIDSFTAIINSPDAAILAVGAIREMPVVDAGRIVVGKVMNLTLCADHRVVDGAAGALFLNSLREIIESLDAATLAA
jgi:pyruvate dehydrogenase E2 component (dihydrolipoamide acetyltransferase)